MQTLIPLRKILLSAEHHLRKYRTNLIRKKSDQPTPKWSLIHPTSTGRRLLQHIFTFVLQLFTDTKSQLNIIYL